MIEEIKVNLIIMKVIIRVVMVSTNKKINIVISKEKVEIIIISEKNLFEERGDDY